jgi:hypothetical protein
MSVLAKQHASHPQLRQDDKSEQGKDAEYDDWHECGLASILDAKEVS